MVILIAQFFFFIILWKNQKLDKGNLYLHRLVATTTTTTTTKSCQEINFHCFPVFTGSSKMHVKEHVNKRFAAVHYPTPSPSINPTEMCLFTKVGIILVLNILWHSGNRSTVRPIVLHSAQCVIQYMLNLYPMNDVNLCRKRLETHTEYFVCVCPATNGFYAINAPQHTSWGSPHPYFFVGVSK